MNTSSSNSASQIPFAPAQSPPGLRSVAEYLAGEFRNGLLLPEMISNGADSFRITPITLVRSVYDALEERYRSTYAHYVIAYYGLGHGLGLELPEDDVEAWMYGLRGYASGSLVAFNLARDE